MTFALQAYLSQNQCLALELRSICYGNFGLTFDAGRQRLELVAYPQRVHHGVPGMEWIAASGSQSQP
jgi:hypothetical protein